MGFKLLVAAAAAVLGSVSALELSEVRESLEETKAGVLSRLGEANIRLYDEFLRIRQEQAAKVAALNFANSTLEDLNDALSSIYDDLAAEDPVIYQEVLDIYFSSDDDLYKYIESKVSPWYDIFDEQEIYDDEFYALVDSYDILYDVVDNSNDNLYVQADLKFEGLYEDLEEISIALDELSDERYGDDDDDGEGEGDDDDDGEGEGDDDDDGEGEGDDDDDGSQPETNSTITSRRLARPSDAILAHKNAHAAAMGKAVSSRLSSAESRAQLRITALTNLVVAKTAEASGAQEAGLATSAQAAIGLAVVGAAAALVVAVVGAHRHSRAEEDRLAGPVSA